MVDLVRCMGRIGSGCRYGVGFIIIIVLWWVCLNNHYTDGGFRWYVIEGIQFNTLDDVISLRIWMCEYELGE